MLIGKPALEICDIRFFDWAIARKFNRCALNKGASRHYDICGVARHRIRNWRGVAVHGRKFLNELHEANEFLIAIEHD